MVKNELKSLLKNKLLIVVLVAIILIPSIYAGFFLASMWDPYGDLEYLPVAVVNNDVPATYNDQELTIGQDLADNLAEDDSMAFNVVDAQTAENGLKNGTYYMVITIPEDFSANAATVMDKEPKKMQLTYETNPGRNYISMKLTESAVKEIKQNIEEKVSKTYVDKVFSSIEAIGDGMGDAVDGTLEMIEGEDKLTEGNDTITENLKTLADGSDTLTDGLNTLNTGLKDYTDGVTKINNGLGSLSDGVDTLSDSAVSGAKQISDGADTLKNGVKSYTKGVSQVKAGTNKLVKNNKTLNNGVKSLEKGVTQLSNGSTKLKTGLEGLQTTLNTSLTDEKMQSISLLTGTALPAITDGITQIKTGLDSVDLSGLSNLSTAATGITSANTYVGSANTDITTALTIINNSSMSDADKTKLQMLLGGTQTKLTGASAGLTQIATGLSTAVDPTVLTQFATLKQGVDTLYNSTQYITVASSTINTLSSSLNLIKTAMNNQIVPGIESLDTGLTTLDTGITGENGLESGIKAYTAGVAKVNKGVNKLAKNNNKLTSGANTLSTGATTLYTGLDTGVTTLTDGVAQLTAGGDKLVANNSTLLDGTTDLIAGSKDIADGADKLKDGSTELGDGIASLADGTEELNTSLADGQKEIEDSAVTDDNIDMIVSPVETSETKITEVKNNGHGMAAYMMSVGLWVACLAFCLMYPLTKYNGKLTNGFSWWASKAAILYPMGLVMVLALMGILHVALGFDPVSMPKTILVGLAATACFMSIMYFFNLLMGKVGSFIMLIFMVLQLAGSAGTYPLEISGSLANALHKWMPFTYSVEAFRSTISGGESIATEMTVLVGISLVFTALTIILFCYRAYKVKNGRKLIYDLIEEKGLA